MGGGEGKKARRETKTETQRQRLRDVERSSHFFLLWLWLPASRQFAPFMDYFTFLDIQSLSSHPAAEETVPFLEFPQRLPQAQHPCVYQTTSSSLRLLYTIPPFFKFTPPHPRVTVPAQ